MGIWEFILVKIIFKILIILPIFVIWTLIAQACRGTVLTKDIFTGKQVHPKEPNANEEESK